MGFHDGHAGVGGVSPSASTQKFFDIFYVKIVCFAAF